MKATDFCLDLCKRCHLNECPYTLAEIEKVAKSGEEDKDDHLCECGVFQCPVATVYAALSGYGHCRSRLKQYEDSGKGPNGETLETWAEYDERRLGHESSDAGEPV